MFKLGKISLPLMLFVPLMQLPAHSQLPYSSSWVNKNIQIYIQHPDWINIDCNGMRQLNRKNISVYSNYAYQLNAQVDPRVASHGPKDYFDFTAYISSNYCPDVW